MSISTQHPRDFRVCSNHSAAIQLNRLHIFPCTSTLTFTLHSFISHTNPSRAQSDIEEQEKEKAEDLKELESKLVSVLMEQQKRMLSVVGSVASASSTIRAAGKFKSLRDK